MDIDKIIQQIHDMKDDVLSNADEAKIFKDYDYLFVNTPTIFFMIKDNKIPDYMETLDYMVNSIKSSQGNSGKAEEKDIEIGEFLAKKYLYPVTDKLTMPVKK
jgi:hypothetical protein